MTILELTANEATAGILLVQERAALEDLKVINVTLHGEKNALQENIAVVNAEEVTFQDTVEEKQRLVQEANEALRNTVAAGQPLVARLQELVNDLNAIAVKLTRSSLEMNAIPSILECIEERETKLRKQIKAALRDINGEICNNQVIGSVPESGYRQKNGSSHRSSENHAEAIVLYAVKLNVAIPEPDFCTFLGVVHPNHGVKGGIKTLVAASILLEEKDVRNQLVYTLAPRVKLFLKHEIKSTNPIYIQMQAKGNNFIEARARSAKKAKKNNDSLMDHN